MERLNAYVASSEGDTTFVHDGLSRIVRIVQRQGGIVVADKAYLWCGLER